MCYRPIKISNPKLVKGIYDPRTLTVPCGHCADCLRNKQQDIYLKLYYEWQNVQKNNGFAYFLTLTYNPRNLPRTSFGVPCFRRSDLQDYIKRVRKNFPSSSIRYFYCGELGGLTRRPHYHIIFFVTGVPFFHFRTRAVQAWRKVLLTNPKDPVKKYNDFGYTCQGRYNNGCVNSPAGLRYVSKYVTKSDDLTRYLESQYKAIDNNLGKNCKYNCKLRDVLRSSVKRTICPFTLSSSHFGASMLQANSVDDIYNNRVVAPDSTGVATYYNLPRTLLRSKFYDRVTNLNGNPSFSLNDDGLQLKDNIFNESVKSFVKRINDITSYPFDVSTLNRINYTLDCQFSSFSELYDYCQFRYPESLYNALHVLDGVAPMCQDRPAIGVDFGLPNKDLYLSRYELTSESLGCPQESERNFISFLTIKLLNDEYYNKVNKIFLYLCSKFSESKDLSQSYDYNVQDRLLTYKRLFYA